MCEQACPAHLLPQQLFWFSQSEDFDKLESHNLFDCIECGACSYVCPSSIPLVQYYRASKGTIRQLNEEKQKSDRARERFELRQERIAKAEAEKEAKRQARKLAAEQAKLKKAEQAKQTDADNASEKPASTAQQAAAQDTPAEKVVDPNIQLAKLERALSSAQSRLERSRTQLSDAKNADEPADEKRLGVLEARIKEAEQKVSDCKEKLAAHKDNANTQTSTTPPAAANVVEKLKISPIEKQEKSISTLEKRIATAKEKLAEAIAEQKPTVDALRQGVEKLEEKLHTAQTELATLQANSAGTQQSTDNTTAVEATTLSAAESAIAKAQAKAEAAANMTPEQKQLAQIEALKGRLEKAQERLRKAEEDNSEHVDAFRTAAEKLETKLADLTK